MLEAQATAAQDAGAGCRPAQGAGAAACGTVPASGTAGRAPERFRPTTRSTREILEPSSGAPRALDFAQRLDQRPRPRLHIRAGAGGSHRPRLRRAATSPCSPYRPRPSASAPHWKWWIAPTACDRTLDLDFDIALSLPNLEERLRVFVTSDALDSGSRASAADAPRCAPACATNCCSDLDFDVGVRVDLPPVAFTAVRWSREVQMGSWEFYPLVKLFAETKESVGYAMGATFDRWSGRQLLRSSTYAKWRHDRRPDGVGADLRLRARPRAPGARTAMARISSADDIGRGWGVTAADQRRRPRSEVDPLRSRRCSIATARPPLAVLVRRTAGALGAGAGTGAPIPASASGSTPCSGISLARRAVTQRAPARGGTG